MDSWDNASVNEMDTLEQRTQTQTETLLGDRNLIGPIMTRVRVPACGDTAISERLRISESPATHFGAFLKGRSPAVCSWVNSEPSA